MKAEKTLKIRWLLSGAVIGAAAMFLAPQLGSLMPSAQAAQATQPTDGKLRIMVLGAHPDDCELRAAGVAAKWAAQGHHVKFVSVTNGDIGHWRMAGGALALRRAAEVEKCAQILGIKTGVIDIHDGELLPTLDARRELTRQMRDWKADIVIGHRPNDYHPDHRYVGVLMQDSSYMVTVPFFCPDSPYLSRNPVFLFSEDRFQKPNPFQADIVVGIDDTVDKKLRCMEALESQFFEGGANGSAALIPADEAGKERRRQQVRESFLGRFNSTANRFRPQLAAWYGEERGKGIKSAEAFEICEYGRQPSKEDLRKLFPFFGSP